MHSFGIHTGADLKTRSSLTLPQASLTELTHHFSKAGQYYYKIARAEDDRPVEANRVRKSIGAETSFAQDLSDVGQMLLELEQIASGLTQLAQCDRIYLVHKYYTKVAYPKEVDEISNSNRLC